MDPPVRPSEELKVSSAAGRLIEVRRSVHESGRIELPRNRKTRRVNMSQQLADELRWLHASRVKETPKGWAEVPVWVFCNEDGKPLWNNKAAVVRNRPPPVRHRTQQRGYGSLRNPASSFGGAEGARTPDPKTASLVLSQLSYSPTASPDY
jgi:hypothetical protein